MSIVGGRFVAEHEIEGLVDYTLDIEDVNGRGIRLVLTIENENGVPTSAYMVAYVDDPDGKEYGRMSGSVDLDTAQRLAGEGPYAESK